MLKAAFSSLRRLHSSLTSNAFSSISRSTSRYRFVASTPRARILFASHRASPLFHSPRHSLTAFSRTMEYHSEPSHSEPLQSGTQKLNRLANEKSPYLLQHKANPVDWYPWGNEAFTAAKQQHKMIFLSVGYSTCHWCHVMNSESFENPTIAALMNKYFINIKVDREERTDVDKLYMTFLQATSGGGGWPMSVFLTPDLEPVLAGTYFPPMRNYGQISFPELLESVHKQWEKDPEQLKQRGRQVIEALRESIDEQYAATTGEKLSDAPITLCYEQIKSGYDPQEGGFSKAPKFPRPVVFELLFKVISSQGLHLKEGKDALQMTLFTLKKMGMGGMYDHIGGGFHRYSVTKDWHIPHFEKMSYDNSQLVFSYLNAFQVVTDPFYELKVRDTLQYTTAKMISPGGGFFSAEDADSLIAHGKKEHAEGAFYVWSMEEIDQLLSPENSKLFKYHFGVLPNGNAPPGGDPHSEFKGKNVLIQRHTVEETAEQFGTSVDDVSKSLEASRNILYQVREKRPHPHLDDKIITAWNGLMISAFAKAHQVLGDPTYLATAIRAAAFIRQNLYVQANGTLIRNYRDGPSNIRAFADDYSFLISGLLDLYEATFDLQWLRWASDLQKKQDELFWDAKNGGYFGFEEGDSSLLLRMKEDYDGAEPSNNSVSAYNLLRLAHFTADKAFQQRAEQVLRSFKGILDTRPIVMPLLCSALDFLLRPPAVIVIVGERGSSETNELLHHIHQFFLPNKVLIMLDGPEAQQFFSKLEYLKDMKKIDNKTTIYICENFTCQLPVNTVPALIELLQKVGAIKQK